ncbi:MAG: response regulator [Archangium sp.]|nr:response regulator [Archangium sp.]
MNRADALLLVVDDSPSMRESLCDLLHDLGFPNVDTAANGATALALFHRTPYDVVITDWYMPYSGGLDLLRAIRGGSQRQDTPVLVLTGPVTRLHVNEALEAGASGFVPKPFVAAALSEYVLELVAAKAPATTYRPASELLESVFSVP